MDTPAAASPLTIFCGKGGVGKTTLSLAFGLLHATRGRKVVVVTSHPLDELAVSISLQGLKESQPEAAANLYVIYIDPREILANRVRQQIPSSLLAKAVISNRIYQGLVEIAPGLKEIAFLARLRELAQRREDKGTIRFELLVWDAPASGHFLQTLRVSRNFDAYLTGPFALIGNELVQFFADPSNLNVIPVTTLEEMAVEETIELCQKIADLEIKPAGLICNLVSPLVSLPEPSFDELARRGLETDAGSETLKFVFDRHRFERERLHEVVSSIEAPLHKIERVRSWKADLELLRSLAGQMESIPAGIGS